MARPLRIEVADGIFHVWNRGVNKMDIVFDDDVRQYFFDLLPQVIRRFGWIIIEPVLMTNHFHMVIKTPEPTLSRGMKWLEQKFAQSINRRYERVGPLFQGRSQLPLNCRRPLLQDSVASHVRLSALSLRQRRETFLAAQEVGGRK